jgi:hypothetical protein
MHKFSKPLVLAGFGIVIGAFWPTAEAQSPPNTSCPKGYWQMGALCLNSVTGDVVNAAPATSPLALEPGCAPGYWRLDYLCLSPATGDVELVDETRWPADRRSRSSPAGRARSTAS